MRKLLNAILLVVGAVSAQDDPITRITVNLVQFDAVVQDKQGRYIRDLKPEEFVVYQDGKRQKPTHVEYVAMDGLRGPDLERTATRKELRARDVRRTIVVIVDDDRIAVENLEYCRRALNAYIDHDFRPGDMVAILTTRYGSGFFSQFTADRELLRATVKRLHWQGPPPEHTKFGVPPLVTVLSQALSGLQRLPGRKSLVIVADGSLANFSDYARLADNAMRAAITIHTMDSRGLPAFSIRAEDQVAFRDGQPYAVQDPAGLKPPPLTPRQYFDSQNLLFYLASETGGLFLHNSNDFVGQLHQIADEQTGYYLVAWNPGEDAFRVPKGKFAEYHKVEIKTTRKGLTVRSRRGYFGIEKGLPQPRSPRNAMQEALFSPFKTEDLNVRLTATYSRHGDQSAIESMVFIDGKSLTFGPEENGCVKTNFEILSMPLYLPDETGTMNSELTEARFCGPVLQQVRQNGLVCILRTPIRRFGPYQVRIAVRSTIPGAKPSLPGVLPGLQRRDDEPTRIGSAYQFVNVPDAKPREPWISTILLRRDVSVLRDSKPDDVGHSTAVQSFYRPSVPGDPAVRIFRATDQIRFGADIYHAADAEAHFRVIRDGREVLKGEPTLTGGVYLFGSLKPLSPGFYLLEVQAKRADGRTATQSIDFEVE